MVAREPKTDIFGMNNIHLKFETKITLGMLVLYFIIRGPINLSLSLLEFAP